jgi:hypothetical protein
VGKKDSAIKVDVLASFSASMEKANITHGFYYSFSDNFYMCEIISIFCQPSFHIEKTI